MAFYADLFHDGKWDDNDHNSFIGGTIFIIHDYCTSIGAITNCKTMSPKKK